MGGIVAFYQNKLGFFPPYFVQPAFLIFFVLKIFIKIFKVQKNVTKNLLWLNINWGKFILTFFAPAICKFHNVLRSLYREVLPPSVKSSSNARASRYLIYSHTLQFLVNFCQVPGNSTVLNHVHLNT